MGLLGKRADANVCDLDGLQPLHIAASSCHAEACRLLLTSRASPYVPDVNGIRACDYALAHGDAGAALCAVFGGEHLENVAEGSDQDLMAEGDQEDEQRMSPAIPGSEDSHQVAAVAGGTLGVPSISAAEHQATAAPVAGGVDTTS